MAKFVGILGVVSGYKEVMLDENTPTSKYVPDIIEMKVAGDLLQNKQAITLNEGINEGLNLNQKFSLLASPKLLSLAANSENEFFAVYLKIWGTKWRVTNIEVNIPRIILTTGGVWVEENGS